MGIVRLGELLAAIGGVALLVVSTLDWYGTRSAWEAFAVLDVVLALVALLAILLAVLNATRRSPALPVAAAVITFTLAAIAVPWVAFRLLDAPGPDAGIESGGVLALLAARGVAGGSWISMRDEPARRTPQPAPRVRPAPPAVAGT